MALEATLGSSPNLELRAEVGKKAVLEGVWKTSRGGPSGSKCVFREAGGSLSWGRGGGGQVHLALHPPQGKFQWLRERSDNIFQIWVFGFINLAHRSWLHSF